MRIEFANDFAMVELFRSGLKNREVVVNHRDSKIECNVEGVSISGLLVEINSEVAVLKWEDIVSMKVT
jgi:hypothetical protein